MKRMGSRPQQPVGSSEKNNVRCKASPLKDMVDIIRRREDMKNFIFEKLQPGPDGNYIMDLSGVF